MGNCGSPIELDEGWLLLTHGVGPVRKYSIGRCARQERPLQNSRPRAGAIGPPGSDPARRLSSNVVYTCGAIRHGDQIVLPYAISDTFSNFATIKIAALMQALSG